MVEEAYNFRGSHSKNIKTLREFSTVSIWGSCNWQLAALHGIIISNWLEGKGGTKHEA
jgi:hypothetical protein